jgi:predicted ester cyclase
MGTNHLDTIREYWRASDEADWDAAGRCVGAGYVWIDHATGVVARTPEELQDALTDAQAWSNTRFQIEDAFETGDGTVIVQAVQSCNIAGSWRSMEAQGQQVSLPLCSIFKFDGEGRIIHQETYYDMLSVRRQLGY